ncbi:MAG: DNA-processing protein DprA [Nitrospinota bacterium]|nr:DNA-processing protein DprA [Nitrospinota bacterium]
MGKSGALITAHFALEQGRDVFAVPDSIFSSTSRETNRLTKMGAKLVDVIEAIVEELHPLQNHYWQAAKRIPFQKIYRRMKNVHTPFYCLKKYILTV